MSTTLEEQILDVVTTKLALILVAGGYNTTVTAVRRALEGPAPLEYVAADLPFIEVRHVRTSRRWHLRGAYECVMELDIICVTAQGDETIRNLVGDVLDILDAYGRWNNGSANLAARTWTGDCDVHEPEVDETEATARVQAFIKFYESRSDPSQVMAI